MVDNTGWGIIGTGWIADQFATGLALLPEAELRAVGSRARESADRFADRFGVPRRHASYEALVNDPEVDVVYVATPHSEHKENCLLCLGAGKPVLCEKPFSINAAEAKEVIQLAHEKGLFLMEAMWTRFFPIIVKLRELLAEGTIGDVKMLVADLGFQPEFDPQHRLFAPELGGGSLLDVGVYPVSFASMVFGPPARVASMAQMGETGVDEQAAVILGYDQDQLATLYSSLRTITPAEAILLGTEGQIKVHSQMFRPSKLTLAQSGEEEQIIEMPYPGNGYQYEAVEVMRCLSAGKLESDVMPLDETLSIMETLDQIRAQWGLKYPME